MAAYYCLASGAERRRSGTHPRKHARSTPVRRTSGSWSVIPAGDFDQDFNFLDGGDFLAWQRWLKLRQCNDRRQQDGVVKAADYAP